MSEHEFELYLSLLQRLLRLNKGQQGEITDELRDHLEERFQELTRLGNPREEAIRRALDECGDAAGLALHFSQLAHQTRRRKIMRRAGISLVGTVALLLIGYFFYPAQAPLRPLAVAHAQAPAGGGGSGAPGFPGTGPMTPGLPGAGPSGAPNTTSGYVAPPSPADKIREKLEEIGEVDYSDVPLTEVLPQLSDMLGVPVRMDRKALEDVNITPDITVSLQLTGIKLRNILKILARDIGSGDCVFNVEDEIILLTTRSHSKSVVIYNCRDLLLDQGSAEAMMTGMMGAGGAMGPMGGAPGMASPAGAPPGVGMMPGGMGMGGPVAITSSDNPRAQRFVQALTYTVGNPEEWNREGSLDAMQEFNGLLIVRTSPDVHQELEEVLGKLRRANAPAVPGMGTFSPVAR